MRKRIQVHAICEEEEILNFRKALQNKEHWINS